MTSREEQKEKRRQQIIFKALELFVKKGYRETKISDIAKAVDMSTGLLFHYFESKEQLYEELVRMGVEGTRTPAKLEAATPLEYFSGFLKLLFEYAAGQPWVCQMFVLMAQTWKSDGVPQHIKEIAMEMNQVEVSAKIIEQGQKERYFREGNPLALSYAFWCSVQGLMEQFAVTPDMPLPEVEWLLDILTEKGKKL